MVDGFPRSANTFVTCAFQVANGVDVPLSHHLHSPGQIAWAVDHGVPVLLLVREPDEVVLSEGVRAERDWDLTEVLGWYAGFHERLEPFRHGIEVADFREVTTDLGAVIDRVNARFGTSFRRYENSPQSDREVFTILDEAMARKREGRLETAAVPRPSDARDALKDALRAELGTPGLREARERAWSAYRAWSPRPAPTTDA